MRFYRIQWTWVILAVVLLNAILITGVAQAKEKEVLFLLLGDQTGPVSGLAVPYNMGGEDYFRYLNDKGGVNGVKVKYICVDTRYDVARGLSAFKRFRRDPKLMTVNAGGTPIGKAIASMTLRDKLVELVPGDGEYQANITNLFSWGPCYQDIFAAALDWMVADWKAKGKSGKPVIGYMNFNGASGKEPLRGGKEYAEILGVKLLPPEFFPPGTLKYEVFLTRIASGGANYVYIGGVDPTQTNIMRDAHALGLKEKMTFVSDMWGISKLGASLHPEALEGVVTVSFFLKGEDADNNPMIKKLWTTYRKDPIEKLISSYCPGVVWSMYFEAALRDALQRVGYEKLTRAEMYESYERITGASAGGIQGPCAYSKTSRRGSNVVKFYKSTKGKILPITDWVKVPDAVSLHKW